MFFNRDIRKYIFLF